MPKIKQIKKEIVMKQKQDYFNNCHASTITKLPNGELLVAYFAGTREGTGDTAIWLSRKVNGKWLEPERKIYREGIPHWNPVLHLNENKIHLYYKVGDTVHTWKTMYTVSEDFGHSWTESQELVQGDILPRGPVKNKVIVLSNGWWIAPGSIEDDREWDAFVDISKDKGHSWLKKDVPIDHKMEKEHTDRIWEGLKEEALWECDLEKVFQWDGVIQPTLWESEPGRVHMLLRSTRGKIYRSDSKDYGATWCPAYPTQLPNNNSGIDVVKFNNGDLALVYNPVSGNWTERSPISISLSLDNGASWTEPHHLELEKGEFSYPAIISVDDELHVTYTWNRKNIIYHYIKISEI
ncbi:sialidase family protein [Peribacillus glennii]|uniref:Sialidase domain-containing protein n=1 Tax=Peribacillus glennii TaxID=2303991 RepID=A0A372LCX4_9BACI|nr:exo-alpha-sialidase [Peribacillus glennii]RFU63865.1 hypothetical protein D0466_10425 [Peribacillus glennii]